MKCPRCGTEMKCDDLEDACICPVCGYGVFLDHGEEK